MTLIMGDAYGITADARAVLLTEDGQLPRNSAGREMRIPLDALLGFGEPEHHDPLWWLSFCDTDKPAGTQFLGVAIVQAATESAAVTRAHKIGVNPGGQVTIAGPLPAGAIAAEWCDRLLTADEADAIPEPGATA